MALRRDSATKARKSAFDLGSEVYRLFTQKKKTEFLPKKSRENIENEMTNLTDQEVVQQMNLLNCGSTLSTYELWCSLTQVSLFRQRTLSSMII